MPQEVVFAAPGRIQVQTYEDSELGPRDVRLRTLYSGISHGTEMALYRGTAPWLNHTVTDDGFIDEGRSIEYPFRYGYEGVCVVEATGSGVSEVRPGDLYYCWDKHRETVTFPLDRANESTLFSFTPLPREAADPAPYIFTGLGGVALEAVLVAPVRLGESVAVFGLGAVGQILVQLCKLAGASPVIAVDLLDHRLDLARSLGADLTFNAGRVDVGREIRRYFGGHGVDVSFECSGSVNALAQAIRSGTPFPKVVVVSMYHGGAADLYLNEEFCRSGGTLIHSRAGGLRLRPEAVTEAQGWYRKWNLARIHATVVELIADGRLRVDRLISHRFPIERAPEAYDLIDRHPGDVTKVIFDFTNKAGAK